MTEDHDITDKLREAAKSASGASLEEWDRWYDVTALDRDLRRKLSFHDLRRLGAHAVRAFKAIAIEKDLGRNVWVRWADGAEGFIRPDQIITAAQAEAAGIKGE
jgi:hypothetical protein